MLTRIDHEEPHYAARALREAGVTVDIAAGSQEDEETAGRRHRWRMCQRPSVLHLLP
jgi:hypothetical protein